MRQPHGSPDPGRPLAFYIDQPTDDASSMHPRPDLVQEVARLTTLVSDAWTAMEARLTALEALAGLNETDLPTEDTIEYWKGRALRAESTARAVSQTLSSLGLRSAIQTEQGMDTERS